MRLKAFKIHLAQQTTNKNNYTIYLGDNIYPAGLPKKNNKDRTAAENALNAQINAVEDFEGKTVFIPGNHDWYANGLKGLKRQEKYIEDALGKKHISARKWMSLGKY